ncbi:hypothetical protein [Actinoplanes sp. NBRC 103695]|uniref:HAAS signaling domain-containing protein n=1 Tax=Actinoplanes sp. NBRC 103695 TaxID=3032202 RepID=UPI0024A0136F|nr:hypothetical protein [Actinoplanes sp. NBRC 103695]GLY98175.1 hypothetical protein Acsp02_54290 [Actinoplanes sp. NBRC 103695]
MSINKVDVAGEYLREVELRLSGLPVLQRHELLADLSAHIETAREQGAYSDGEMVEVLQRLGSPEAIAAAAYEEAGPRLVMAPPEPPPIRAPAPAPRNNNIWAWVIAAAVGFFVLFLIGVASLMFFSQVAEAPVPAVQQIDRPPVQEPAPDQPVPARPDGE